MPELDDGILDEFERRTNGHANGSRVHFLPKGEFIKWFVAPDYIIDGILQRGYFYALTGSTGHAKSAIALLIAELMGSPDKNAMLGAHKVEKGKVLYFVGENPTDLCMRVIGADSKRLDDPSRDQIVFFPGRIDFKKQYAEIVAAAEEAGGNFALVFVDTSAAYFPGEDENANKQMGEYARDLRELTKLPGHPCVVALCHPTKRANGIDELLPRGGGAFIAEIDGNLTARRTESGDIEFWHTKFRGPGFEPMTFKLERIETTKLVDSKGRILPTVRAVIIEQSEQEHRQRRQTDDEDRVLLELVTFPGKSFAQIAEALSWRNDKGELNRSRAQRCIEKLVEYRLLKKNRDSYEATDNGKKAASEADKRFRNEDAVRNQQNFNL
jgi:hypothetical protein